MKTNTSSNGLLGSLFLIAFLLAGISSYIHTDVAHGQGIPTSRLWRAEPYYMVHGEVPPGETNRRVHSLIQVVWPKENKELWVKMEGDSATEITFIVNKGSITQTIYSWPRMLEMDRMTPTSGFYFLPNWKQFAEKIGRRFAYLGDGLVIEKTAYFYVGSETNLKLEATMSSPTTLLFQDSEDEHRIVVLKESDWLGKKPKKGAIVYLGRTMLHGNPCCFPAKKTSEANYVVDIELTLGINFKNRMKTPD